MKKNNILRTGSLMLLLSLFLSTTITVMHAQEVRDAAASKGVKFGSPLFQLYDSDHQQLFRDQISVGTVTAYWKFNTHNNEGYYTWGDTDNAVSFGEQNGWELHGHPLVWGSDTFIPDWVKNKPTWEGEAIMLDHIRTVVGRYRGRIATWDVVNEAIEDDGTYRNCYWNRAMTGEYIAKAFIEAKNADPDAVLLYNDYGIETNGPKFNTVKSMLGWIRSLGAQVDGLGWQLHVDVNDVLDAGFPLEQRMQEISDMGLDNYVTELDVRIPNNSSYWLERQKQAYKKIAEIFLRNPTRGPYFQTWGIADKYTWFNDYDPGNAPHHPLPFGYNFEKKPAYWGLFEAFNEGNEGGDDLRGELRIKNLWSNTYLHQNGGGNSGGIVSLHEYRQSWYSQRWNIESSDAGTYRLRCSWGSNYLNNTGNYNDAPVNVYSLNTGWWSQQWYIENAYNNVYRLKNRWTSKYLHTGNQYNVSTYNGNPNWWSQLWVFEYISQGNRLDTDQILDLTVSPNPATDIIYLNELSENTNYIIYNTSGQVVAEGTGVMIDVHQLTPGTYLLTAFPQDEGYEGIFGRALFVKK